MKNLVDSRPKLTSSAPLPSASPPPSTDDDGRRERWREKTEKRERERRGEEKKEEKDGRFPVSPELDFTIFLRSRRNGNVARARALSDLDVFQRDNRLTEPVKILYSHLNSASISDVYIG